MEFVIKTGFQSITHNINFQPQTIIKGKNLVLAQHVRDVEEHRRQNESYLIKSRVIRQASVHSTPYTTSLNINSIRCVTDVKCDCVYNQSKKCKHIAALIYFINSEESATKTSSEQQWGKPSARQFAKSKYSKGKYFEEMFPPKKTKIYQPQDINISELVEESALKQVMVAQAGSTNVHTVTSLMNSLLKRIEINLEKEDCAECVKNFHIFCDESMIYKSVYKLESKLEEFYVKNIEMPEKDIINLCCKTLEQSNCTEWYTARRLRFSASKNVHSIKVRTTKTIQSLVSDILFPHKINCASIKYGITNEPRAKNEYEKLHNCMVKRVGVIVCKFQPWLCASLDGVVVEDGCISKLVEFKCPSSCQNKAVINLADNSCNVKYLKFFHNKWVLKETDSYYTQIQVQMYVSGMNVCDLFVYSPIPNGSCVIQVHRDDIFLRKVILKSEHFYFQYYLPALYVEYTSQTNAKNNENSSTLDINDHNTKIDDFDIDDNDDNNNNNNNNELP